MDQLQQIVLHLPILTTVAAAVFCYQLFARYRAKGGGLHLLWWGIGMVTYGLVKEAHVLKPSFALPDWQRFHYGPIQPPGSLTATGNQNRERMALLTPRHREELLADGNPRDFRSSEWEVALRLPMAHKSARRKRAGQAIRQAGSSVGIENQDGCLAHE